MNRTVLFVLGVVAIIVALFLGMTPLPGQHDSVTAHTQRLPPGTSPEPATAMNQGSIAKQVK